VVESAFEFKTTLKGGAINSSPTFFIGDHMSLFGDIHQLKDGLKLVEQLTIATERLVDVCSKLNDNVERLVVAIEQQNKELTVKAKKK
jgi:predicted O-linked N-acetylglucosamine transferase (SPINDLY family)